MCLLTRQVPCLSSHAGQRGFRGSRTRHLGLHRAPRCAVTPQTPSVWWTVVGGRWKRTAFSPSTNHRPPSTDLQAPVSSRACGPYEGLPSTCPPAPVRVSRRSRTSRPRFCKPPGRRAPFAAADIERKRRESNPQGIAARPFSRRLPSPVVGLPFRCSIIQLRRQDSNLHPSR